MLNKYYFTQFALEIAYESRNLTATSDFCVCEFDNADCHLHREILTLEQIFETRLEIRGTYVS